VISGIGKGISAAAIGLLLKMRGVQLKMMKFDPYLNMSASLLAPKEHGEVHLADDGSENDLDMGSYERIAGVEVSGENICTAGKLYNEILTEEVEGRYMGRTVQIMPHVTDKILDKLFAMGKDAEVVICEIGGTVGDMESGVFFEAVRQLKQRLPQDTLLVHVAPILWIPTIQEFKTKPLQNSVRDLQHLGLTPDILLCRVDRPIPGKLLDKVAQFTNVPREAVFEAPDVASIYEVPLTFYDRHIDDLVADRFKLKRNGVRIHGWRGLVERLTDPALPVVTIGLVCKYADQQDAYLSLKEAISHAGAEVGVRIDLRWIDAERLEEYSTVRGVQKFFDGVDAIIVPGGFDIRGVEGKIKAVQYARERQVPFLGICLGLQCAVIEFARNVCGIADAHSAEFRTADQSFTPVVHFVPGMEHLRKKGGTLRLGAFDCVLAKGSLAHAVYRKKAISERHRHRYEVNGEYVAALAEKGLTVTGTNPGSGLVEVVELPRDQHPFFIGCQYHPEFKSRLDAPHPLFIGLIEAAVAAHRPTVPEVPVV
jgi:CTP synthase